MLFFTPRSRARRRVSRLLLLTLAAPALATGQARGELAAFFDTYMTEEMSANHVAGAVVSVVQDGRTVFARGYGYADVALKVPANPATTLVRIGSMSKIFVWTAVMQLVEQGLLDLNRDVNEYLDFEIPATFSRPITLSDLMAHNSGFEDRKAEQMAASPSELVPLGAWLKTHVPARIRPRGELSAYGNYNAALAGYIVERVSGMPYEQYVERAILQPLGMEHTTARQPVPGRFADTMSQGYFYADGQYRPQAEELLNAAPAGAMKSTAADIARFMIAHLADGRLGRAEILSAETARLMRERSFSHDPRVNGWAHGFTEMSMNGERIIGHAGSTFMFNSLMMLFPARGLGVFVATNSQGGGAFVGNNYLGFRNAFVRRFFPAAVPAAPPGSFSVNASRFAGSYRLTMGESRMTAERLFSLLGAVTIKADGNDLVAALPGGIARFTPLEPLVFRQTDTGDTLVFKEGSRGLMTEAFYGAIPLTALIKDRFYETPGIILLGVGLCVVGLASAVVGIPILALIRGIRKRRKALRPVTLTERLAAWVAAAASLLSLALLFCAMASLTNTYGFFTGHVPLWRFVPFLSVAASVLAGALLVCLILIWRNKAWFLAPRILYTLVFAAVMGFGGFRELFRWFGGGL